MPDIVLVQASHVLTDAVIIGTLPALSRWDNDFLRPAWGLDRAHYSFATLRQFQDGKTAGAWPIFINNHSRDSGVLGFHDLSPGGVPFGRVFVGDCRRYGISWTVDLSHEAGEMREDPDINNFFVMADGRVCMREVGDAVESDENGIVVDNQLFTDFTMPDYFSHTLRADSHLDYQRKLRNICPALTRGGYMAVYENGAWGQVTALFMGGPPSYRSQRFHQSHRGLSLPVPPTVP